MAYNKLASMLRVLTFHDDVADARIARHIGWTAMDGECFLATCKFLSGTGVLAFKIFANTTAGAAGAVEVVAHSDPTPADAANDTLVLETHAEEILAKLKAADHDTDGKQIYVSVNMDNDAAADVNLITYVVGMLENPRDGATAEVIA